VNTDLMISSGTLVVGLVVLVYGADVLVKYASALARHYGVSPLIVGLTVLAFGTSLPELAVSITSALKGESGVAVGNVVGSNIANIWLILGLSALAFPLVVRRQLLIFDIPVMVLSSCLMLVFAWNGQIARWEGVVLLSSVVVYIFMLLWMERRVKKAGEHDPLFEEALLDGDTHGEEQRPPIQLAGLTCVGLVLLVLGSNWMVSGAVDLARFFGVEEIFIGLTIVAIGTSLPELATTFMAALRKETDMAIGNIVGSNIFNILVVLGMTSTLSPIQVEAQTVALDIPLATLACVVCLPLFAVGQRRLGRVAGAGFFLAYLCFLLNLIIQSQFPAWHPRFSSLFFQGLLPLIILLIVSEKWMEMRALRQELP
jgi:cation:H+ antiporter